MDFAKAQTICQVLIAVFSVLAISMTFGSFYFGKMISKEENKTLSSQIASLSSPELTLRMNAIQKLNQAGAIVDGCTIAKGVRVCFHSLNVPFETACDYMKDIPDLREIDFNFIHGTQERIDISLLSTFTNLVSLDLSHRYSIKDISVLRKLNKLVILSLRSNQIYDISPLSELKNLQFLYLDNNPVANLKPLAECTNLRILSIAETEVTDLQPLITLKELQELSMSSFVISSDFVPPPITDAEVERFCTARPDVQVRRPHRHKPPT